MDEGFTHGLITTDIYYPEESLEGRLQGLIDDCFGFSYSAKIRIEDREVARKVFNTALTGRENSPLKVGDINDRILVTKTLIDSVLSIPGKDIEKANKFIKSLTAASENIPEGRRIMFKRSERQKQADGFPDFLHPTRNFGRQEGEFKSTLAAYYNKSGDYEIRISHRDVVQTLAFEEIPFKKTGDGYNFPADVISAINEQMSVRLQADIDRDGKTDFIFEDGGANGSSESLFVSSLARPGKLLRLIDTQDYGPGC